MSDWTSSAVLTDHIGAGDAAPGDVVDEHRVRASSACDVPPRQPEEAGR